MAGNQRGTSALLVAASLLLLMGMAAIGVDLGSGFNTRRQNQTAADLAATSGAVFSASETLAVAAVLEIARENMPTSYTDAEWQSLWQSCVDPSRPSGYLPLDDPWSAGKLDCISAHPAANGGPQLRVRIPDQVTATSFGRILGMTNFLTRANAHATFRFVTDGAMIPFGVLNGTPTGTEQCVVQPSPGLLAPPCDGPNSGNFGTMEIPAWGNTAKQTTVECNRSSQDLFAQNVAIGSDHVVLVATGPDGTPASFPGTGGPHPDDGGVPYPADYAKEDACNSSSGEAVATDPVPATPLNTVDTNTGSASDAIKLGLIGRPNSEPVFPGGLEPRLRRTVNSHTLIVREKDGSDQVEYVIDNTPLWEYLRAPGDLASDGIPLTGNDEGCNRNYIATRSWPDNRTAFMQCLQAYETYRTSVPDPKPLFTNALAGNPRLGWAPVFHYTTWGSGTTWQPVESFTSLYFDGIWFNCNGSGSGPNNEPCNNTKGLHFYPGEYPDGSTVKSGSGPYGGRLRLDQMTAIVIPAEALPAKIRSSYPGILNGPFQVELVR